MNVTRRSLVFAGATALGGVALTSRAWADAPAALRGVLVQAAGPASRVTLALDIPATPRTGFLVEPHRFVIDLPGARLATAQREVAGNGVIRRARFAQHADYARVVLDLEAPASIVREGRGTRRAPELSFDLAATQPFVPAPAPLERAGRDAPRRTIVIDAGHGGRDPGAVGVTGVREKDVVLDAALKLRQALEHRGRYSVALTRDADRFVELEDRVQFARAQHGDLFISLHADANANRDTQGASVYTLSENGAARAQNLMGAQNWNIDIGDARRDGVVGDILVDLAQRETTNRSAQFAQTVIPRLGQVTPLLRNTHRNAGFFVLLAPDVPAVLIETGFLSNVADERRLADPRNREQMAEAMAGAVDAYFAAPQMYASA
jgi:N-acetylmuramoyl-L-alanine amidase